MAAVVLLFLLLCCVLSLLKRLWNWFWNLMLKQTLKREFMQTMRKGKKVTVLVVYEFGEIFGIPLVEYEHRRKIRRHIRQRTEEELETFVFPILKLVDGKVTLVGGKVCRRNKRPKLISAEEYLHYYDEPKYEPVVIGKLDSVTPADIPSEQ